MRAYMNLTVKTYFEEENEINEFKSEILSANELNFI